MAALTVWTFSSPAGADEALDTLGRLQSHRQIQLYDAAVVSWPAGARKPATHEMYSATGAGALGGGFWGLLFGLIFFMPLLGLAIGAAGGAILGSLKDVGISETFIADVRDQVTPGTSALFALTSDAVPDGVAEAFSTTRPELIRANLSAEQEARLREVFSQEG
jgi:uncharacterized membrane protein